MAGGPPGVLSARSPPSEPGLAQPVTRTAERCEQSWPQARNRLRQRLTDGAWVHLRRRREI